ncbi:MAG: zinc metallopeptidase, partial [Eubacteriaceae bacterium]|nr:zinc metallopeptidase [Eubacteriaceae bacterium]
GIAAHETGHAIQDAQGYFPLKFRNFIVPICNFTSNAAWPMFFIGLLLGGSRSDFGLILMDLGIIFFAVALVFYLVTLPVELNASHRAVAALVEYQLVAPGEERAVKKVLSAAAMTYVASTLMAFLNLFRMLAIRGRN